MEKTGELYIIPKHLNLLLPHNYFNNIKPAIILQLEINGQIFTTKKGFNDHNAFNPKFMNEKYMLLIQHQEIEQSLVKVSAFHLDEQASQTDSEVLIGKATTSLFKICSQIFSQQDQLIKLNLGTNQTAEAIIQFEWHADGKKNYKQITLDDKIMEIYQEHLKQNEYLQNKQLELAEQEKQERYQNIQHIVDEYNKNRLLIFEQFDNQRMKGVNNQLQQQLFESQIQIKSLQNYYQQHSLQHILYSQIPFELLMYQNQLYPMQKQQLQQQFHHSQQQLNQTFQQAKIKQYQQIANLLFNKYCIAGYLNLSLFHKAIIDVFKKAKIDPPIFQIIQDMFNDYSKDKVKLTSQEFSKCLIDTFQFFQQFIPILFNEK